MTFDDETLMAFVDGELDVARAVAVTQAVERDRALGARVERMRAVRRQMADAFAPILDEPIPEGLRASAMTHASSGAEPTVRQWAGRGRQLPAWTAMAAGLAGLVVGAGAVTFTASSSGVGRLDDGFVADAALARALDVAESGTLMRQRGLAVTPLYSFVTQDGRTCRAFVAARNEAAAEGVACREADAWRLLVVAPGERAPPTMADDSGAGVFRQADGGEPAAVTAAIDEVWSDTVLDDDAERAAIAGGW